jgi:hypothetical protein
MLVGAVFSVTMVMLMFVGVAVVTVMMLVLALVTIILVMMFVLVGVVRIVVVVLVLVGMTVIAMVMFMLVRVFGARHQGRGSRQSESREQDRRQGELRAWFHYYISRKAFIARSQ